MKLSAAGKRIHAPDVRKKAACIACFQVRFHAARGLCVACYGRYRRAGTLDQYGTPKEYELDIPGWVEECKHLGVWGADTATLAARFKVNTRTIQRRLHRARELNLT